MKSTELYDRPEERLLLGPGPSNVHPRVTGALGRPLVGHLDPEFLALMDQTQERLRQVFQTSNRLTVSISGTGSAGMQAAIDNLVEEGDDVLVCINGAFGARMAEMARRLGATVRLLERPWGTSFEQAEIEEMLDRYPKICLVAIVHAETSTGVLQPLEGLGRRCRERGVLLLVDAVTSLGGCELRVDDWAIDACYSGTQKCLSCPPGLAPLTFGPRALERLRSRRTPVRSWYFDLSLIDSYWTAGRRAYHHTAPIAMNYALHEALGVVLEEGLEPRWARHRHHSRALCAGLEALGFELLPPSGSRLPMLNAVRVPAGVDEAALRGQLLAGFGIEVGGGLGALAGKIWRIGLMGESSRRRHVVTLVGALETLLGASAGPGLAAVARSYDDLPGD